VASLVLAVRRFRDGRAPVLGLVLLVLVTAACAAATPRVLDRVADDALRAEVANATPFQRNIQLVQERGYDAGPDDDPMSVVRTAGERLEAQMAGRIRDLFSYRTYVVDSGRWTVLNDTVDPAFVRLRVQQDAEQRIRIVAGHLPTTDVRVVTQDRPDPEDDLRIVVLQVALSVESLDRVGLKVGDTLSLEPDATDRLVGRGGEPVTTMVDVVGSFTVDDERDPYWVEDAALVRPTYRISGDNDLVDMTALVASAAYREMTTGANPGFTPFRYTWHYFVDRDRLESERLDGLLVDLRRLESTFPSTGGNAVEAGTSLQSGLLLLLEGERARWASAVAVLAVVGLGPAAVGLAALALIGVFVMQRRRPALALGRARGASSGQLLAAVTLEGLIVSLPPAVLAALLAFVLVPTGPRQLTIAAAVAVAIATTILLVAAGASTALATPRGPGRDLPVVRRPGPRRLAIEGLVVALAVIGAFLLRERGIRGASSTSELAGADPFIALVPALAGIAAGIVAVRLLPIPMLLLSRLAAIRRDLVPVLALRRVTRGGTSGPVLVVLMATATIGAFSGATLVHLDRAAEAVAWEEIGAPYRVEGTGPLPLAFDPLELPGVTAAAGQFQVSSVVATRFLPLQFVAIDTAEFQRVVEGTAGDGLFPPEMVGPSEQPIPAIVSRQLTTGTEGVGVGGLFDLVVEGYRITFRVVEVRESFPTLSSNQTFVVASRDQLRALRSNGGGLRSITAYYLRAPDDAADGIREALPRAAPGATLASRAERTASIETSPTVEALVAGVTAAAFVAFAYAALAVSAALALAGAARAIEVAHLRTLGLTRREAVGLVIVEHGPTIIIAFVGGVALGLGLFALLREGLGLAALVGSSIEVTVGIEPIHLLILLIAIVIIVGLGIGLGTALQRGAAPAAAVRRGFE
jgi:putative ABC transport system permease protein